MLEATHDAVVRLEVHVRSNPVSESTPKLRYVVIAAITMSGTKIGLNSDWLNTTLGDPRI
jgi:hypothetical protein